MRKIWNEGKTWAYIRGQPIAIIEEFQVCEVPEQRRRKVNCIGCEERPDIYCEATEALESIEYRKIPRSRGVEAEEILDTRGENDVED
jgi:hypothetical protein